MKYYAINTYEEEAYARQGTGRYDINMPNNQGDLNRNQLPDYEPGAFQNYLLEGDLATDSVQTEFNRSFTNCQRPLLDATRRFSMA